MPGTAGKAFFAGIAAERFAVRNSGATAVCEGEEIGATGELGGLTLFGGLQGARLSEFEGLSMSFLVWGSSVSVWPSFAFWNSYFGGSRSRGFQSFRAAEP